MTEDLTTYTDKGGVYTTITASRVTLVDMWENSDIYVYKDFGVDFFDKIDLYFAIRIDGSSDPEVTLCVGLANNVNDADSWTQYIQMMFNVDGDVALISSTEIVEDYSLLNTNTVYYLHLHRVAGSGTMNLYIYSDSARTTLVHTLTTTLTSAQKFRYLYPAANRNTGEWTQLFNGYVENFIVSLPQGGQVRVIGMAM